MKRPNEPNIPASATPEMGKVRFDHEDAKNTKRGKKQGGPQKVTKSYDRETGWLDFFCALA